MISGDRFSAASAMKDWTRATRSSGSGVTPSRIMALHQSCSRACLDELVVLIVGAEPAEPADQGCRRIDLEDSRAFGELFVGHLQEPLHLGAHAAVGIHQAARAVGQPLRFPHLSHTIRKRGPEELENAGEPALLARALRGRLVGLGFGPVSGRSRSAESIEVSSFPGTNAAS